MLVNGTPGDAPAPGANTNYLCHRYNRYILYDFILYWSKHISSYQWMTWDVRGLDQHEYFVSSTCNWFFFFFPHWSGHTMNITVTTLKNQSQGQMWCIRDTCTIVVAVTTFSCPKHLQCGSLFRQQWQQRRLWQSTGPRQRHPQGCSGQMWTQAPCNWNTIHMYISIGTGCLIKSHCKV